MRWLIPLACLAAHVACAQCGPLDSLQRRYERIWDQRFEMNVDNLGERLFKDAVNLLGDAASFPCDIDSNSAMQQVRSDDGAIRVLSWDHFSTGSWHDMVAIAQVNSAGPRAGVAVVCSANDPQEGQDPGVLIHQVTRLSSDGEPLYLLLGWGTFGGGEHHSTAMVFGLHGSQLMLERYRFPTGRFYGVSTQRSHVIALEYDPAHGKLTHNGFASTDDDSPWSVPTGKQTTLQWNGSRFIPIP